MPKSANFGGGGYFGVAFPTEAGEGAAFCGRDIPCSRRGKAMANTPSRGRTNADRLNDRRNARREEGKGRYLTGIGPC